MLEAGARVADQFAHQRLDLRLANDVGLQTQEEHEKEAHAPVYGIARFGLR